MRLLILCGLLALPLAGCTSTTPINMADGSRGYNIACGAGLSWGVCYHQANDLCPAGYNTVSKDDGFDRKEMVIACPPAFGRIQ